MGIVQRIKGWFDDDVKNWWRFWSVRLQLVCAFLTGWMWFDPNGLLWVWNAMPRPVRALLPDYFMTGMGAILFLLSIAAVFARQVRQPKLEKKNDVVS